MFDVEKYIESGVIESYCLGNLSEAEAKTLIELAAEHPAVQAEIDRTLEVLENYGPQRQPSPQLKNRVLNFLDAYLQPEKVELANLPLIHLHSDVFAWAHTMTGLEPEVHLDNFAIRELKKTPELELNLVWLYGKMVEDEHDPDEFVESFLILEGACECDFEGKIVRFGAGDYFDVPPGVKHVIRNISETLPYIKGVVQRRKVA
jgi:mannose-6-phosphate isomerase-like protein (cupin superfamily)